MTTTYRTKTNKTVRNTDFTVYAKLTCAWNCIHFNCYLLLQIAEIIDERPDEVKQLEVFRTSNKWKVLGGETLKDLTAKHLYTLYKGMLNSQFCVCRKLINFPSHQNITPCWC